MLTDYTTYDDVRSALGVSDEELADATLALESVYSHLLFDLEDVGLTLPDDYTAVAAIAEASRTTEQQRFYRATRLFSTLATARALAASLPLFGPKDISDGKATVSRFADAPYKATIAMVDKQFEQAKSRLEAAWAATTSSTATVVSRPYIGSSKLSVDPVTGS